MMQNAMQNVYRRTDGLTHLSLARPGIRERDLIIRDWTTAPRLSPSEPRK